ncbi:MAG: cytochrome c nitrite reductase small subunit [Bacteroidales bacterium]|nr:cytochrome c nitrite reductase small subunit [Bacteroidales bacterium]
MRKFIQRILPPDRWKVPVLFVVAIAVGFVVYLGYISKAHSYLSDDPKACVNCHIMAPQYATWAHSAHREVTNCNSCHVPHDNIFSHYYFKAKDGLRHASIFTMRAEPQVIFIKEAGIEVVQQNCIRCHDYTVHNEDVAEITGRPCCFNEERLCWDCHRTVPHGRVNSLSSVPNARVPLPESPVPGWLEKLLSEEKNQESEKLNIK